MAYPQLAQATLLLPDVDSHGSIHLKFPPDGPTFQSSMRRDEGDDEDEMDRDVLRLLAQMFGGYPRQPAHQASTARRAGHGGEVSPKQEAAPVVEVTNLLEAAQESTL
jgi:hypothetical protein